MPAASKKLEWAKVRLGEDLNWWVEEISDDVHWDVDGLGILDPRQIGYIMECCDPFRDYGFDFDIFEESFFAMKIAKEEKGNRVMLRITRESLIESDETLFALPDVMDEEKGPYADFLDQVTKFRVKLLNDLLDLDENLTIDELEDDIRERQNTDYMEGRAVHFFTEITNILEYVPEGFEHDLLDDEKATRSGEDDGIDDIPDFDDDEEEKIEEDETMKWDDDDEDDDDDDESRDDDDLDDLDDDDDDDEEDEEEEDEPKPRRGKRSRG